MPANGEQGQSGNGESTGEVKKKPTPPKKRAPKKAAPPDAAKKAKQAVETHSTEESQPGSLAEAVSAALTPPSTPETPQEVTPPESPVPFTAEGEVATDEEEDVNELDLLFDRIADERPRLLEPLRGYSDEETMEALERLSIDDQILHPDEYADSEFVLASYGEWAPSIISGMDTITHSFQAEAQNERLAHPRILMLGAQSPIAVTDVVSFTKPFAPESITVADISPVALDLAQAQEPNVQTAQLDWYDPASAAALPEFDIAIGNRIVDIRPGTRDENPFRTARQNAREVAGILGNVAPRMSENGGMVLTLNMPDKMGTQAYERQLYLLRRACIKQGLLITHAQQVVEFDTRPTAEEMSQKSTYTALDAQGHLMNMLRNEYGITIVVKRLTEDNLEELQAQYSAKT